MFAVKRYKEIDSVKEEREGRLKALGQNARVLSRVPKHNNIVQYYGIEKTSDTVSIFMEYVPGGNIRTLIERFGALDEPVIQKYASQVLIGLAHFHKHKITHGGLTNQHVYITSDGTAKLAHTAGGLGAQLEMFCLRTSKPSDVYTFCLGISKDLLAVSLMILEMATANYGETSVLKKTLTDMTTKINKFEDRFRRNVESCGLSSSGRKFLLMCVKRASNLILSNTTKRVPAAATSSQLISKLRRHPFIASARGEDGSMATSKLLRSSDDDVDGYMRDSNIDNGDHEIKYDNSTAERGEMRTTRLPSINPHIPLALSRAGASKSILSQKFGSKRGDKHRNSSVKKNGGGTTKLPAIAKKRANDTSGNLDEWLKNQGYASVDTLQGSVVSQVLNDGVGAGTISIDVNREKNEIVYLSSDESSSSSDDEDENVQSTKKREIALPTIEAEDKITTKRTPKVKSSSSRKWTQRAFLSKYGADSSSSNSSSNDDGGNDKETTHTTTDNADGDTTKNLVLPTLGTIDSLASTILNTTMSSDATSMSSTIMSAMCKGDWIDPSEAAMATTMETFAGTNNTFDVRGSAKRPHEANCESRRHSKRTKNAKPLSQSTLVLEKTLSLAQDSEKCYNRSISNGEKHVTKNRTSLDESMATYDIHGQAVERDARNGTDDVEFDVHGRPVKRVSKKDTSILINIDPKSTQADLLRMWYLTARLKVLRRWYAGKDEGSKSTSTKAKKGTRRYQRTAVAESTESLRPPNATNSWWPGIECSKGERLVLYDVHPSGWCIVSNTLSEFGFAAGGDLKPNPMLPLRGDDGEGTGAFNVGMHEEKEVEHVKGATVDDASNDVLMPRNIQDARIHSNTVDANASASHDVDMTTTKKKKKKSTNDEALWNWDSDVRAVVETEVKVADTKSDVDDASNEVEDVSAEAADWHAYDEEWPVESEYAEPYDANVVRMVGKFTTNANGSDDDGQRLVAESGDLIEVIEEHESGWWCGQVRGGKRDGEVGWFPCSFTEWADPYKEDGNAEEKTGDAKQTTQCHNTMAPSTVRMTINRRRGSAGSTFGLFDDTVMSKGWGSETNYDAAEETDGAGIVGFVRAIAAYVPENNEDNKKSQNGDDDDDDDDDGEKNKDGERDKEDSNELALDEDDVVAVIETQDSGWWYGRYIGAVKDYDLQSLRERVMDERDERKAPTYGWFPCTYTEWIEDVNAGEAHDDEDTTKNGDSLAQKEDIEKDRVESDAAKELNESDVEHKERGEGEAEGEEEEKASYAQAIADFVPDAPEKVEDGNEGEGDEELDFLSLHEGDIVCVLQNGNGWSYGYVYEEAAQEEKKGDGGGESEVAEHSTKADSDLSEKPSSRTGWFPESYLAWL
eukprot:g2259.t1